MNSAEIIQQQADVCRNSGKTSKAISLYKKAFSLFEKAGDFGRAGHTLQMIGVCYKIDNDSKNTLLWLKKAKKYYEKTYINCWRRQYFTRYWNNLGVQ